MSGNERQHPKRQHSKRQHPKRQLHKRLPQAFVESVLEQFNQHAISEAKATQLLQVSRARLYALRKRWLDCQRRRQPFSLYARLGRTHPTYSEEEAAFLREQLAYIQNQATLYRGQFNFAFLAEEAQKRFGHPFHRNSLRRFAIREGYYHPPPSKPPRSYVRFQMAEVGALYQHDTSTHLWIPALGRNIDLILTEDDHSRLIVGAQLVNKESSFAHLCVVRASLERYGLPLAYYVDNHAIFRWVAHDGVHQHCSFATDEVDPQFKRALESLDIGVIYASHASSKGKIEKRFDYFQRRLPLLCEKYQVTQLQDAQTILSDLMDYYNERRVHAETEQIPRERWQQAMTSGRVALRAVPEDLDWDYPFSLHQTRKVRKDGTISFEGVHYPVDRYRGSEVTVCLIPEQKLMVYKGDEKLAEYRL